MTDLRSPYPMCGGKKRVAAMIWQRFGDTPNYIEPFLGSGADGARYRHTMTGVTVIMSRAIEDDGHIWLHVSMAHPHRMPTYEELADVKERFIGADKKAVMVFPPKSVHVNIHNFCLHLWHRMDGDSLPEFSGMIGGKRSL